MRIAIDAMGGDFAPLAALEGARLAAEAFEDVQLLLVGDQPVLEKILQDIHWSLPDSVRIVHAPEVVGMGEKPVEALRKKKKSSVSVGADLVKQGEADALVTAGNTGAAVAATTLKWRQLEGVDRPGIALPIPNLDGVTVLIDAGANVECRQEHYYQYAVMGKIYAETIFDKYHVRVGLLNVGEEDTKGHAEIQEVHRIFKKSYFNFIGNVEGRDLYNGRCDVVVCDGFIGNIVLKVSEGAASAIKGLLKKELKRNWLNMLGAFLSLGAFKRLKKRIDYAEYGGAPLLGVNGICIISHGSSSKIAFFNAIRVAREFVRYDVNARIVKELKQNGFPA